AAIPVTSTWKLHDELAAIEPPDKLITPVFCVAVMTPLPHDPLRLFGVATTRPAGNASVNATPVRAIVLLFWIVKLNEVEPFSGMLALPNALVMTGATGFVTVTTALACAVAPFVSVTVRSTVVSPCGYGPA